MIYEAEPSKQFDGEWIVEAINRDGEVYTFLFSGPLAKERAVSYAAWQNSLNHEHKHGTYRTGTVQVEYIVDPEIVLRLKQMEEKLDRLLSYAVVRDAPAPQ